MPGAVYSPAACIQLTLAIAREVGLPCDQIIFEITEAEVIDRAHIRAVVEDYRQRGFKVALDDFGAGYCGLNLLADFPADIIKLDMDLIRNLPQRPAALAIVNLMVELARTFGSQLIAEGIETVDEYNALRRCGIHLMQGYLFAKPAFETLPRFTLPNVRLDAIGVGDDSRISTPIALHPLGRAPKTPHIPLHWLVARWSLPPKFYIQELWSVETVWQTQLHKNGRAPAPRFSAGGGTATASVPQTPNADVVV
jgi:hypothetical protein